MESDVITNSAQKNITPAAVNCYITIHNTTAFKPQTCFTFFHNILTTDSIRQQLGYYSTTKISNIN